MPESIFPSLAQTPKPPYFAVIFTSVLKDPENTDYMAASKEMLELVDEQPGFLGLESFRDPDGVGVTISYWTDLDSIQAWKDNVRHRMVQKLGYEKWYKCYKVRITKVERDYGWLDEGLPMAGTL